MHLLICLPDNITHHYTLTINMHWFSHQNRCCTITVKLIINFSKSMYSGFITCKVTLIYSSKTTTEKEKDTIVTEQTARVLFSGNLPLFSICNVTPCKAFYERKSGHDCMFSWLISVIHPYNYHDVCWYEVCLKVIYPVKDNPIPCHCC